MADLIIKNKKGLYVPQANAYIDPWRPVDKALISHIHADHCRHGNKQYICPDTSKLILKRRLGVETVSSFPYGQKFSVNGVQFSFHPAGHIPGSAQIKVEYKGEVWVYSGDYKTEDDGLSHAFEPVKCHTFITECTFGLPVYRWVPQQKIIDDIQKWWNANAALNRPSLILAYSLGKAQRLISALGESGPGPVYCHSATQQMNSAVRKSGFELPKTKILTEKTKKEKLEKALVIISPSGLSTHWKKTLKNASTAMTSGWMSIRGAKRRSAVDMGFSISDHADWEGLHLAIKGTGAERIICTHGYQHIFSKWLNENGWQAEELETEFVNESE